jgi:hypothetical protein
MVDARCVKVVLYGSARGIITPGAGFFLPVFCPLQVALRRERRSRPVTGKDRRLLYGPNHVREAKSSGAARRLEILTPELIDQIDRALAELGPFAEVRLIKARGRLRFIQKLDSESLIESQSS